MTRLTPDKPVRRETDAIHGGRPIIVTLTSEGFLLHEKGRRTRYLLPLRYAFDAAARLQADAIAEQRTARKKKRRRSRSRLLKGR